MAKITTLKTNVIGEDAKFRKFAIDAVLGGAVVTYAGDYVVYEIHDHELAPERAELLLEDKNTTIEDYFIKRWYEVVDLNDYIPQDFPLDALPAEDEDGEPIKYKWADVVNEATLQIDGKYYPEVGWVLNGNPNGLTYDQYKNIKAPLLTAEEVNALKPVEGDAGATLK